MRQKWKESRQSDRKRTRGWGWDWDWNWGIKLLANVPPFQVHKLLEARVGVFLLVLLCCGTSSVATSTTNRFYLLSWFNGKLPLHRNKQKKPRWLEWSSIHSLSLLHLYLSPWCCRRRLLPDKQLTMDQEPAESAKLEICFLSTEPLKPAYSLENPERLWIVCVQM